MQDQANSDTATPAPVCIAICTFNRHALLRALLAALPDQAGREVPVLVLDNGTDPAGAVVAEFRDALSIRYHRVEAAGVVAVRNAALRLALDSGADHVAFIDDDEVPEPGWLAGLRACAARTGADIVFGPVLAAAPENLPRWVARGALLDKRGKTYGSGNALIRLAALPPDPAGWFQPSFSATGGEDYEFFTRLERQGARVADAPDAVALEHVPADRLTRRFFFSRGLREGIVAAQIILQTRRGPWQVAGAALALAARKLGYALNHLVWSPLQPWRLVRAGMDACAVAGLVQRLAGRRFHYYGAKPD